MFKAQERIEDIGVQAQKEAMRRHAERCRPSRPRRAEDAYRIRVDLAVQLAQIEVDRIVRESDHAKQMVMAAEAQKQLYTDLAAAQDELEEKRAEAARKHAEELQRQLDSIQKTSSGLIHTLFTKPQDFPKQLGGTIHEAILKPVTEGLGGMVAGVLHPIIYGSDGQGGISGTLKGIFGGGKQDPMKTATDQNTVATAQNSAHVWALTATLAAFMGMSAPAVASPSIPGLAGASMPAITMSMPGVGGGAAHGESPGPRVVVGHGGVLARSVGRRWRGGWRDGRLYACSVGCRRWVLSARRVLSCWRRVSARARRPRGTGCSRWQGRILPLEPEGIARQPGELCHQPEDLGCERRELRRVRWLRPYVSGRDDGGDDDGHQWPHGFASWNVGRRGHGHGGRRARRRGHRRAVRRPDGRRARCWHRRGRGLRLGLGEKLFGVESPENEAKRLVKQLYSISIDNSMAKQIVRHRAAEVRRPCEHRRARS